jgi:hypothetical protein
VVIYNLNIFGPIFFPIKANTPFIVDTNTVLAGTLSIERFKAISRRNSQIIQPAGNFELSQPPSCHRFNIPKPPHADSIGKSLSVSAFEGSDHVKILTHRVNHVKRYYILIRAGF